MGTDVVIRYPTVPPTRSTCSPIPTQAGPIWPVAACHAEMITALGSFAFRAGATCWPPSSSPSGYTSVKTISSSQSPPTARPCTRASSPERSKRDWTDGFTEVSAAQVHGEHVLGAGEDHVLVCSDLDRNRIFNLGYYTWVEQQGVSLEEFEVRRDQSFWRGLLDLVPVWDDLITELNGRSGALATA